MNAAAAVGAALGAAALFAAGTALQYRAATFAGPSSTRSSTVLRRVLVSPVWLVGTALLGVGLGFHAYALHQGSLSLVQPLLITGVLFTLPASRFAGGPRIRLTEMLWAALLVGGLAVFLVTSTPTSQGSAAVDWFPATAIAVVAVLCVTVCLLVARRSRGAVTATVLGVAAGIGLAGSAALIKVCTDLATKGLGVLFSSWQLYVMAVVGLSSVGISQLAYRSGPMTASIPAINTVNPVASVFLGWAAFDDTFRVSPGALALEAVSLTAVLASTLALSRRSAVRHSGVARDDAFANGDSSGVAGHSPNAKAG